MNFDKDSVEFTNIIPLWARATYFENNKTILNDPMAKVVFEQMIKTYSLDVEAIKQYYGKSVEFFCLNFLSRAYSFDIALKEYLFSHPEATVVNIGAGFDTSFYRNDNGLLKWYEIDLPEVIKARESFLNPSERHYHIAQSVFDYSWLDSIEFDESKGIFLIAGGVFYYFLSDHVKNFLTVIGKKFRTGQIVFDYVTKIGMKIGNKKSLKAGMKNVLWKSFVNNPVKEYRDLFPLISVKSWWPFWKKTPINPLWEKNTKKMIKIASILKTANIILLEFNKIEE